MKTRTWTLPTILGLVIGVVGATGVIELRPQISVAPEEPIEKSQPFSVPFRIDNTGYLSFAVEHVYCYVHEVHTGQVRILNALLDTYAQWKNVTLEHGDGGTTTYHAYSGPISPGSTADIVIVIDYKPFPSFPHAFRKYFRFEGQYIDNWQWVREPSTKLEASVNKKIDANSVGIEK